MTEELGTNRDGTKPQEVPAASDKPTEITGVGLGLRDTSADAPIYHVEAGGTTMGELSLENRLREAVERAIAGARAFVISARVAPVAVRGPERTASPESESRPAVVPAELLLPGEATKVLGPVQSHVVFDGDCLQVWLSRLERLSSGSVVTLIAATADGEPVVAELTVNDRTSERLRFALPWPEAVAPEVVMFVVRFDDRD